MSPPTNISGYLAENLHAFAPPTPYVASADFGVQASLKICYNYKPMKEFDELVRVVHALRKKCPWDKEQTPQTLKPYLLEETREAIEAIDNQDDELLSEELGDKLLHIVMLAEMLKERKTSNIRQVIQQIMAKMIRRHPHVFGKSKVKTVEGVLDQWQEIKRKEKKHRRR